MSDGRGLVKMKTKELINTLVELTISEDYVRSEVGAPTLEEEQLCCCGEELESCPDSYVHMTSGV